MLGRSKGLQREPNTHPVGGVHHSVLIGAPPIPSDVDWSIGWTDQRDASSCTGHAFKKLIEGTARINGYAGPGKASAEGIYALRAEDYPGLAPLPDEGASPSTIATGLSRFGTVEEAFAPKTVADRLSVDELMNAQAFRVTQIALIDLYGDSLASAIQSALAAKLIPVFAMDVDDAYEKLGPGQVYDGPVGPSLGGHMQAFDSYSQNGAVFGVAGSWGPGWASAGRAWMTRAAVARLATNVYIAKVVPVLT